MSQRALNKQLFHGTTAPLGVGDTVRSATAAGVSAPNSRMVRSRAWEHPDFDPYENAHATGREEIAWGFADRAVQHGGATGRSRVLAVSSPDARPGLENKKHPAFKDQAYGGMDHDEYVSPQFKVTDVQDIQPPESVRKKGPHMRYHSNPNGRQGTLPIDWAPFVDRSPGYPRMSAQQANHPTQAQRLQQEKRLDDREKNQPKHPPMYMAGLKVADQVSEKLQRPKGGMKQPMLPGMRGMKP